MECHLVCVRETGTVEEVLEDQCKCSQLLVGLEVVLHQLHTEETIVLLLLEGYVYPLILVVLGAFELQYRHCCCWDILCFLYYISFLL
jgi:hypothetical protein